MKKKTAKGVFITLVITSIIILALYINYFRIGNVRSVNATFVADLNVNDTKIELFVGTSSSATGYKGFEYEMSGNTLEIKVFEVLVSNKFPSGDGQIIIEAEFEDIDTIFLVDNENKKEIWSK